MVLHRLHTRKQFVKKLVLTRSMQDSQVVKVSTVMLRLRLSQTRARVTSLLTALLVVLFLRNTFLLLTKVSRALC